MMKIRRKTVYVDSKGDVLQLRSYCNQENHYLKHRRDGLKDQQAIVSSLYSVAAALESEF